MAIDEALLENYQALSIPLLRIYSWQPACLSLGRYQNARQVLKYDEVDKNNLVRRISGGGAIFHQHEITYSIICTDKDINSHSVRESYAKLCSFLLCTYSKLGLKPEFALQDSHILNDQLGVKTDFCFAGKEHYDILVAGRKIGGNAQRRKGKLILQHGSIPIRLDLKLAQSWLKNPALDLEKQTVSLSDLGVSHSSQEISHLLTSCFADTMKIQFEKSLLTQQENEMVKTLLEHKYQNPSWTSDGKEDIPC